MSSNMFMDKVILCQLSVHKAFDSPCGLLQVQAIIEDISLLILAAEGKIKCTKYYKFKKRLSVWHNVDRH